MFEVCKFCKEKCIVVYLVDKSRGEVPETLVGPFRIGGVYVSANLIPA